MDAHRAAQLSSSKVYELTAVETGETPLELVPRRIRRAAACAQALRGTCAQTLCMRTLPPRADAAPPAAR
jgi:hypothetical protein